MPYCILYRLGEACNHIAALLFSLRITLMMRNCHRNYQRHQNPWLGISHQKEVSAECACNMKFVKPSHADNPDLQNVSEIKRSSFDPCLPEHRIEIKPDHLHALLTDVQKSVPNTGIQQFWCDSSNPRYLQPVVDTILWSHVLFSPKTWNCEMHVPSLAECYHFINGMKISYSQVTALEAATRAQSESELWVMQHNGRLTSSWTGYRYHGI